MNPDSLLQNCQPRYVLQQELVRRCRVNPSYSMRSFAKSLDMSPTALSLVLSGKRPLSVHGCKKISARLGLTPTQQESLLASRVLSKQIAGDVQQNNLQENIHEMEIDRFHFISDWYHYAILSLIDLPTAKLEANWISQKLGISHAESQQAIERLKRMDLVEKTATGWRQKGDPIRVNNQHSTAASQNFNRGLLEKALVSLDEHSFAERSIGAGVFAIDESQMEELRQELRSLRRQLLKKYHMKGKTNRVYALAFLTFPISERIEK